MPNLKITASFRDDAVKHQHDKGASAKNPGGGLARKAEQLSLALPTLQFVPYLSQAGNIHITEPLWFSRGDNFSEEVMEQRINDYKNVDAYKILWTSDLECLRWKGSERDAIFDATDVIALNSEYFLNLLSAYVDVSKTALLTDPIDPNWVTPSKKEKRIYGASQVIFEKGIGDIINIFSALDKRIDRWFLGSTEMWGMELNPVISNVLDRQLHTVCDKRIKFATRPQVKETASASWLFTSFAGFESFGYAMIEALLAGCWVFCGNHLVYRDRPVYWFNNADDAIEAILEFIDQYDPTHINETGRQFVIDNYSLDVFRKQFIKIIGRCI